MGYQRNIKTERIIKNASELSGVLRSDVVYRIDGLIDLGAVEITVPAGGLFLLGTDYFKSGLFSTEDNHTMFKTASGVPTTNVRIKELNFWTSGVASKLFQLDGTSGFGAIEFNSCNLGDFGGETTEIGEFISFRQFRTNDAGFFRVKDGLTFSGEWAGGVRITDSISIATVGTMTLFKAGPGLLFKGRSISDINASSLNDTTTVFGFTEANFFNDGGFQLKGAEFNSNAPAVTLSESSTKAFFKDCVGIRNTRPGFETVFTSQVATPLTLNVYTKILGTTVTSNNTWWTQTANNEIRYDSDIERDFEVIIPIDIGAGPNDEIGLELRRWNFIDSTFQVVKRRVKRVSNVLGPLDIVSFVLVGIVRDMKKNDFLTLYKANTTDDTDATTLLDSELVCKVI